MLGLCIEVRPTGFKAWRFRYRFGEKGRMIDLGTYPQISLQDARKERDKQRDIVAKGSDPADVRRQDKAFALVSADDSFEAVAREWMRTKAKWSLATRAKALWLFETYAFPGSGCGQYETSRRQRCLSSFDVLRAWVSSRQRDV